MSSDSYEKRATELENRRSIDVRYTYSGLVTISKMLDLVGIPSILRILEALAAAAPCMLHVRWQMAERAIRG